MAITTDLNSPAAVTGSGGTTTTLTTASYTPSVAGTLVVAVAGAGWSPSGNTITISDSGGHTWTPAKVLNGATGNRGSVGIWWAYLATTAAITVTATYTFSGGGGGRLLQVTGYSGTASSSPIGATAQLDATTATTTGTFSISPTTVGSMVLGASDDPDTMATWTATSGCTARTQYNDSTDALTIVSWAGPSTTTTGPVTVGGTWSVADVSRNVAVEILPPAGPSTFAGAATLAGSSSLTAGPTPAPGIAEDASTPAPATLTGLGTVITTAAFSPPAGSLLVALVVGGWSATQPLDATISDTAGGTWTAAVTANQPGGSTWGGLAKIFYRYLSSAPGSITATVTYTNIKSGRFVAIRVLTGAASNQSGAATATAVAPGNQVGTVNIVPTAVRSVVYGASDASNTHAAWTANASTTTLPSGLFDDATDTITAVAWKAITATISADVGTTKTFGGTWASNVTHNEALLEVLAVPITVYAGAATLTAASGFSAAAGLTDAAAGTLTATADLSTAGAITTAGAVALGGVAGLSASAGVTEQATVALSGGAGLTAAATKAIATTITLAGTAGLTTAMFVTELTGVTFPGAAVLLTAGTRVALGAVALPGVAVLIGSGVPGPSVTLPATAALVGAAGQTEIAAVVIAGAGTFGGPLFVAEGATVALPGVAGLVSALAVPGATALAGVAALGATAASVFGVTATLPGVAALVTAARLVAAAAVTLPGVAKLTGSAFRIAGGTGVLFAAVAALRSAATLATPGQVLAVSWWALNNDGTYLCALPDAVSWQLSLVDGSPGAVTLDYPANGANFSVLRDSVTSDTDLLIAIWIGGKDPGSLRALLNTAEGDDVAESGVWRFSGNFLNVRMEEAGVAPRVSVVTPPTGPAPTTDLAAFRVYAATAGTVVTTLMGEAHTRGALSDITYIFTNTVDSHGVPWSKTITLKIAPGTDYLTVLASLVEAQMCEWDIVDHELVLWEYGTRGVDYTLTTPPIILRAGDILTDSPRKHTVRGAATTLTVAGGEGLYTTASDATAIARRGRAIEQFFSQGSLTDAGSLSAYTTAKLLTITAGVMEVGGGIALTGTGPEPLIAYRNGDWLWYDTGLGLERLRIKQLTVSCDSDGVLTAGLSLNDLIADQLEQLAHRLAGIEGGTTITGTSNASPIIPDAPDTVAPAAPNGVIVTSLAQPSAEAVPKSAVFATWAAPITNVDGTVCTDLGGYNVQWRYLNPVLVGSWIQLAPVGPASTSWSGVIAGEAIEVRVQAYDLTGNTSTWSVSAFHTTQTDVTPPPVPSTPVATEFLGTLTATWNGLGSAGETMPADFVGVQIHRSTTTGFTPGPSTFVENMLGSGSRNYPDLPLGVTQFFKLISYDRTGNLSAPSAQASGVPAPVGMGDIAFSDPGNLVEDGSFEVGTSRATHTARSDTAWTFVSGGADNGTWFARGTGSVGSGLRALVLSPQIPTTPGSDYAIRWAMRATGVNGDVSMRVRWTLAATTTDTISAFTPGFSAAWTNTEVGNGVFTAPAGAVSLQIIVMLHANCTAGTWDLDRVEARETIGTLLVRDLAVTDAKILTASVGKLTAGTITAVMLMAGLLRSAATGLRYEIDANGVRFYDSANNLVIDLNRASASATLTGTLQTGITGRRIVVSGPTNTIKFLPQADESRWAQLNSYVPVGYPNDVAVQLQAISSAVTDVIARLYVLPDQVGLVVETSGGTVIGGAVEVQRDGVTLSLKDHNGGVGGGGLVALSRSSAQFGILNIDTSPSIDCHLAFDSTGAIDLQGKFVAGQAPSNKTAVIVGTAASPYGLSVFYGSTMQGTMTPMVTLRASTPYPVCVTATSATNFSTAWNGSSGETVTVHYWVYRT